MLCHNVNPDIGVYEATPGWLLEPWVPVLAERVNATGASRYSWYYGMLCHILVEELGSKLWRPCPCSEPPVALAEVEAGKPLEIPMWQRVDEDWEADTTNRQRVQRGGQRPGERRRHQQPGGPGGVYRGARRAGA